MAWLSYFKLGRPGYETSFDVNPAAMHIAPGPVAAIQSNLAGDLRKSVFKASAPSIRINSNYLTIAQRNTLTSLAEISDTFLSFLTRDDWQKTLEYNLPTTASTVTLQGSSALRLGAALVAASFSSNITIVGVWTAISADGTAGSGTNYFTGGAYVDSTKTITLGSALPNATQPVYCTYTYTGWLVNLKDASHTYQGGWVDQATYDFALEGA